LGGVDHDGVTVYFPDGDFILDSRGRSVPHPAFYETEIETLRRLNRNLSHKKEARKKRTAEEKAKMRALPRYRRDRNIKKARYTLAKWHDHIARRRDYFLWQQANYYAQNFGRVTLYTRPAKLPIQYAVTSDEARKLCDAAYARLTTMLKQKCEEYETELIIKENPEWPKQKEQLTEVAKMERLQPIVRKTRRALRLNHRGHLQSLQRDCTQVETLQLS